MPEKIPAPVIQNAFTAGELDPNLYGRTDLEKYKSGCALLQNLVVNFGGGVSSRPGSQFVGHPATAGFTRLIPFEFNEAQTYVLVFSNLKMRVIKPAVAGHVNAGAGAYVLAAGVPYELTTPYLEADLRGLKFMQIADVVWITKQGYSPYKLSRLADNNWVLTSLTRSLPAAPAITAVEISDAPPPGGVDPEETRYMYCVTSVDDAGNESPPSEPFAQGPGINIGTTQGTVTVFWSPVAGAKYYKVYKALPTSGNKIPNYSEQFGFAGFAYGTLFTDSNIVADFAQGPLVDKDPFIPGQIIGYSISAPGSSYPLQATALNITDSTGTGAILYPIFDTNTSGDTGGIVGIFISKPGRNYTAPTVAAAGAGGSGFTATLSASSLTNPQPDVVGTVHQRIVFAAPLDNPVGVFATRTGTVDDFRQHNPVIDSDAFDFSIFQRKVSQIVWLQDMPGGLVIGTRGNILQLTGGSSGVANPVAITPTNAVITPLAAHGVKDVPPIAVEENTILYVLLSGSRIEDLQYNALSGKYASSDLTILVSHLFAGHSIVDWAYQGFPNRTIWAVREDGVLLSLTYFKAQEVIAWAHHITQGTVESITCIQEFGQDVVYMSVLRNGSRCIERLSTKVSEAKELMWVLDSAVYEASGSVVGTVGGLSHLNGMSVMALVDGIAQGPFTVSGGSVTLTTAGFIRTVGLAYTQRLQPLYAEPTPETVQGRRKKVVAVTARVRNSKGLRYGLSFDDMKAWVENYSSTDIQPTLPYAQAGLFSGDQRIIINKEFELGGWVCVEQTLPYNVNILAIIPEFFLGDTE